MIFRIDNSKQIDIYDYYVTNALVLKFRDVEDKSVIEDFFNPLGEISAFDIVNSETQKIINHYQMDIKYTHYSVENTEIIEYEDKVIQEAWDEEIPIEDSENVSEGAESESSDSEQKTQTIHHDAIIEKVEKRIPAEITSVFLEKPSVEMSISSVKNQVKKFQKAVPNTEQLGAFLQIVCDSFTDEQALLVSDFYDIWEQIPDGTYLEAGRRVKYGVDGVLYKVKEGNGHNKQSTWNPIDSNLFEAIEPTHTGTIEDPIPAHKNMKYYQNKYYDQDGTIYLCNSPICKDGILLAYLPSDLLGVYFEKIDS